MTHYSVLGITIPPYVPSFVIKEKFKALATQYSTADKYPDSSQPLTALALEWMHIEHAYSILMDDKKRKAYDQALDNMIDIVKLLEQNKYHAAKIIYDAFEEIMPTLFLKQPNLTYSILANDDLHILANMATTLAVRAEKFARTKPRPANSYQLFADAEQYYRITIVLRKRRRIDENIPTKFEMNAVSNLCNFLYERALEAVKARNTEYAKQLITEQEVLVNNFMTLLPAAILQLKDDKKELLKSGLEFFEASINVAVAYQSRGKTVIAKRYFFQSLEICTQLYSNFEDLSSRLTVLENEIIAFRKFSELNLTDDTKTLVDKYLQRQSEFSNDIKMNLLFPLQRILTVYVSAGQWDLARNYCTQALMLAKNAGYSAYDALILIHLDCALILERDLCLDNDSKQPQDTCVNKTSLQSQNTSREIATILHHYRTAFNYAIYNRDLDGAILACEKIAGFYMTLSKEHASAHTNYRALAEFFLTMTHFKQSDLDNDTFQKIQKCFERTRSTGMLRNVCVEICILYKRKYKNCDEPHIVQCEQFNHFIDILKQQKTIPLSFWKHSTKRDKRNQRRHQRMQNEQATHSIESSQESIDQPIIDLDLRLNGSDCKRSANSPHNSVTAHRN